MSSLRSFAACRSVALAVLALSLSAATCTNTTSTVTPGGTIILSDRFNSVQVPGDAARDSTANCQPGEQMVSGGYAVTTPAYNASLDSTTPLDRYFVYASYPLSTTAWTASILNRTSGDILATVHVECAAGLTTGPNIFSAAGAIRDLVSVPCIQGSLTGGGFQITNIHSRNAVVTLLGAYATSNGNGLNTWNVQTLFATGSSVDPAQTRINAFAVCASLTTSLGAAIQVTAAPGAVDQATLGTGGATCGAGQLLMGAGFRLNALTDSLPISLFYPDYGSAPPQWDLTLHSLPVSSVEGQPSNPGGTATLIPICAIVA